MKVALFLGAGASAFAGQPPTAELLKRVGDSISKYPDDARARFLRYVVSKPELDDVEKLYNCVDQLIDIQDTHAREVLPELQYHIKNANITYQDGVEALKELKSQMRKILLNAFKVKPKDYRDIVNVYDSLCRVIETRGAESFNIITTNYDEVIEEYCEEAGKECVCGFEMGRRRSGRWIGKWIREQSDKDPVYLTKLHGSINWYEDDDGEVIEVLHRATENIDNDVLIFPTLGPKKYDQIPFDDLMRHFNETINEIKVLVMIGFSYRDQEINEVIKRRLKNDMKLFSISRKATRGIKNLLGEDIILTQRAGNRFFVTGSSVACYDEDFGPETIKDVCDVVGEMCNYYLGDKET